MAFPPDLYTYHNSSVHRLDASARHARQPSSSRPLPSPPPALKPIVVPDPELELDSAANGPLPTAVSHPKRTSFISTWISGIEPGSPSAPSPRSVDVLPSPLLSANTQDVARRLLEFAGLPGSPALAPAPSLAPLSLPAHVLARKRAVPPLSIQSFAPPPADWGPARSQRPSTRLRSPVSTLLSPASVAVRSPANAMLSPASVSSSVALRQFHARIAHRRAPTRRTSTRRALPNRAASTRKRRTMRQSRRVSRTAPVVEHVQAPSPVRPREVFLDDDEWEFAPLVLLHGDGMIDNFDDAWEDFDEGRPQTATATSASVYSHPSDLDAVYALPNPHDVRSPAHATPPDSGNSHAISNSSGTEQQPQPHSAAGALLTIPARSRRRAAHLRKPSYVTADEALALALALPPSPVVSSLARTAVRRRRPTPLNIPSPARSHRFPSPYPSSTIPSPSSVPQRLAVSPHDVQRIRKAFLAQSFAPRAAIGAADVGAVPAKVIPPTIVEEKRLPASPAVRGRRSIGRSPRMQSFQSGVRSVWSVVSGGIRTGGSGGSGSNPRSSSAKRTWL